MMTKGSALVIGMVFTLAGCVSQGTYEEVLNERDALEKQNRSLQANVKLSRNQTDAVSKDLSNVTEELKGSQQDAAVASELYTKLVGNLADEVANQQVTIKQMKSGVVLNLPEGILFDSGSAIVKKSGVDVLKKVAKQLESVPYQTIIGGYTDSMPISKKLVAQFPSNWELAAVRATTVARQLQDSGIPKDRLVAVSFGETRPIASNDTKEGRAQNRRIEIRLRPILIE